MAIGWSGYVVSLLHNIGIDLPPVFAAAPGTQVKLADGSAVGVDWTSPNLNNAWFGGSHWIPNTNACNGNAWREVIIAALRDQASVSGC